MELLPLALFALFAVKKNENTPSEPDLPLRGARCHIAEAAFMVAEVQNAIGHSVAASRWRAVTCPEQLKKD